MFAMRSAPSRAQPGSPVVHVLDGIAKRHEGRFDLDDRGGLSLGERDDSLV